jgi:glucokinase
MFLAGDIGGTSTRLSLYSQKGGFFCIEKTEKLLSHDFPSLETAISTFLEGQHGEIESLCIGVPGPVRGGRVRLTNLPWNFSEDSLRSALNIPRVRVVNDLYAFSHGVPLLNQSDFVTLHEGGTEHGNEIFSVLAPGTGLGHALSITRGREQITLPSEGGHIDFAPRDEISIELLRFLVAKFKRVSVERVVSGPGLLNIYEFLGTHPEMKFHSLKLDTGVELQPEHVAQAGLEKSCPRSTLALDIFARALGGLAGNFVLTNLSTGGMFLCGGIPPKLIEKLKDGSLVEMYLSQGRLSGIVADTSLRVVMNPDAGLLGAAYLASKG